VVLLEKYFMIKHVVSKRHMLALQSYTRRVACVILLIARHGDFALRSRYLPLATAIQMLSDVELKRQKYEFDTVWRHVHNIFDFFLAQAEAQLLEHLRVERVPVVSLLRDRVRLAVVVHVHHLREVVLHHLGGQHGV
jgi:hypothetical protein